MTANELKLKVKQSIKMIDPDARVILFGSRARGDNKITSDWDFLILISQHIDEQEKKRIRDKLLDTELEAEEVISSLIFSKEKWNSYRVTPLYKNISRDGIEL